MIQISQVWFEPFLPIPILETVSQILNLNSSISFQSICDLFIRFLYNLVTLYVSCQQLFFSASIFSLKSFCILSSVTFNSLQRINEFSWQFLTLSSIHFKSLLKISLSSKLSSLMYLVESFRGRILWILCRKSLQVQLTHSTFRQVRQYSVRTLLCCTHRSWLLLLCIRLNRLIQAQSFYFLKPSQFSLFSIYLVKSSPLMLLDYMYLLFSEVFFGEETSLPYFLGDLVDSSNFIVLLRLSWLMVVFLLADLEFCIVKYYAASKNNKTDSKLKTITHNPSKSSCDIQ